MKTIVLCLLLDVIYFIFVFGHCFTILEMVYGGRYCACEPRGLFFSLDGARVSYCHMLISHPLNGSRCNSDEEDKNIDDLKSPYFRYEMITCNVPIGKNFMELVFS